VSVPVVEAAQELRGRTVLVTGGTGFIGCRLVERLILQHGVRVRVLVRDFARAVRVATFPVELVPGSVLDPATLAAASTGCDTVFHCAYGTAGSQSERARTNRDGTRNVLEAALARRVRRVVCLSTLMVYGHTPDGDLDETAPRRRYGDTYSDSKYDAELLALALARQRGAPVVLLQPTAVYGPYGGVWTELPLRQLASGRVILVGGGDGIANAVYVDDLVSAMLLAAVREGIEGEAFLVSGAQSESWREFYEMVKGEASGKTVFVDSMGDVFVFPLKMLGYSLNSTDQAELEEARQILLDVAPHLYALDSDKYGFKLKDGTSTLTLGWTGPLGQELVDEAATGEAGYVVPSEGTLFWMDTWVMMADAPHPNAAYAWLNYIHEPEVQGIETNYNLYATCNDAAKAFVDPAILANPAIFPPEDVIASLEGAQDTSGNTQRIDIWEEFKQKIGG